MTGQTQTFHKFQDDDWKNLLPEKMIPLNDVVSIPLKPLGMDKWELCLSEIETIIPQVKKEGITLANFRSAEKFIKLIRILVKYAPGLLEKATNLEQASIKRLPIDCQINLVNGILEVNIESHEGLEKNLGNLADQVGKLTAMVTGNPNPEPAAVKESKVD